MYLFWRKDDHLPQSKDSETYLPKEIEPSNLRKEFSCRNDRKIRVSVEGINQERSVLKEKPDQTLKTTNSLLKMETKPRDRRGVEGSNSENQRRNRKQSMTHNNQFRDRRKSSIDFDHESSLYEQRSQPPEAVAPSNAGKNERKWKEEKSREGNLLILLFLPHLLLPISSRRRLTEALRDASCVSHRQPRKKHQIRVRPPPPPLPPPPASTRTPLRLLR